LETEVAFNGAHDRGKDRAAACAANRIPEKAAQRPARSRIGTRSTPKEAPKNCASTDAADRPTFCKRICKRTTQHSTGWGITRQDHRGKKAEPEHTLSYCAAHTDMRILELENRCTGNRTVGSNPTLSANTFGPEN
jgi:hypothetical protein